MGLGLADLLQEVEGSGERDGDGVCRDLVKELPNPAQGLSIFGNGITAPCGLFTAGCRPGLSNAP